MHPAKVEMKGSGRRAWILVGARCTATIVIGLVAIVALLVAFDDPVSAAIRKGGVCAACDGVAGIFRAGISIVAILNHA